MKTLKHLNKEEKIELLKAIESGEVNPNDITENTKFCTESAWWDFYIMSQDDNTVRIVDDNDPDVMKIIYLGKGKESAKRMDEMGKAMFEE